MKASLTALTSTETPVLVDFFATWCGPCQTMSPILQKVKEQLGERIKIVKIDIDKNPKVATQLQVRSVPTFVIFKEGKPVWRRSGVLSQSDLISEINKISAD